MNKICYFNLATYSQTGGIENYNKSFLKALSSLDKQVTSVSVYDHSNKENFANVAFKNFSAKKIKASIYILINIYKVDKLILAHMNLLPIAILGKIIYPKLTIYLSIYGIEAWKRLPLFYRVFLTRVEVLSISAYTTDQFKKNNFQNNRNVFYLPPHTEIRNKVDFDNVYNGNKYNILSVTRLDCDDSYKGVDSMLKAMPLLIKKIPNIKYTIIGAGDDKKRLVSLSLSLGVEDFVDFKGFVEDVSPYYQFCDIFSLPSKGEGFGIVYIEAMKYKKPCIACNKGGQTDVVIDGETGYLCKYDDISCLSKKIIKLYKNPDLSKAYGEKGFQYLMERFSFDKFIKRLSCILNNTGLV